MWCQVAQFLRTSKQKKMMGVIAVALGYTAHLVSMISFLQVPLRYSVIHKGSRSTTKDNINDKLD